MKENKRKADHISYRTGNKRRVDSFIQFFFLILVTLSIASCSLPKIIVLEDPLSPEEHLNLGVTYEKNGELDNALEEYKKASKFFPLAYTYIGNIYYQKGEFKKAENYYKKAIKKEPNSADAYNNLAWLYYTEKKNLNDAEELVLKALQLDPSKQDVYQDTLEKIREHKRTTQ
jgi:tetratricopeptide (TPR) repeat protein